MGGRLNRTWEARLRVSGVRTFALLAIGLFAATQASAQTDAPRVEIFTGFEASDNYASGYLGAGYAFGKGLYEEGLRARAVGSFGRYHYQGTLPGAGDDVPVTFDGEDAFIAALI